MFAHYQLHHYAEAITIADNILDLEKGDYVALSYKGNACLYLSTPSDMRVLDALSFWSQAVRGINDEDVDAFFESTRQVLAPFLYGLVNKTASYWRTYENGRFATDLVSVFDALDESESRCKEGGPFDSRLSRFVLDIFKGQRVKWIGLVTGIEHDVPVEMRPLRLKGYADVLSCMSRQVLALIEEPSFDDSRYGKRDCAQMRLVSKRTFDSFKRFGSYHPDVLSDDQKELLNHIESLGLNREGQMELAFKSR